MAKTDKTSHRIQNVYKTSNNSLLSVVLRELVNAHNSIETMSVGIQTEPEQLPSDVTVVSLKSRPKKSRRGKNHGLVTSEFKSRKPKKVKEVTVIAQNLEKMSCNIGLITNKLDDLKRNPSSDESKSIIGHVGNIMNQLNGCISNFESICQDIKQINETRIRSYDEWMDDLRNSENGRRFLRKLQKSFSRVLNEEKTKVKSDCRKKLERDKSKLEKLYRRKSAKHNEVKAVDFPHPIIKEIDEIVQSTCLKIHSIERQDEIFLKSLNLDLISRKTHEQANPPAKFPATKLTALPHTLKPVDLNKCRKLYSETSSDSTYNSEPFESQKSDEKNWIRMQKDFN